MADRVRVIHYTTSVEMEIVISEIMLSLVRACFMKYVNINLISVRI